MSIKKTLLSSKILQSMIADCFIYMLWTVSLDKYNIQFNKLLNICSKIPLLNLNNFKDCFNSFAKI